MENCNCDGSGPHTAGEVRLLPMGRDAHSGNLILCRSCHAREIAWRRERNLSLGDFARFDLPEWDSLQVYKNE